MNYLKYKDCDERIFRLIDLPLSFDANFEISAHAKLNYINITRSTYHQKQYLIELEKAVLTIYPEWSRGERVRVVIFE